MFYFCLSIERSFFYPFLSKLSMYKNGSKTGQTYLMLYMESKIYSYDSEFHDNLTYPYTLENIFIFYIYISRILASFLLFTCHGNWSFLPNTLQTSYCNILGWPVEGNPSESGIISGAIISRISVSVCLNCYQPVWAVSSAVFSQYLILLKGSLHSSQQKSCHYGSPLSANFYWEKSPRRLQRCQHWWYCQGKKGVPI